MVRSLLTLLSLFVLGCSSFAQTLTIAAAADLQFALQDVAQRFEQSSGSKVKLIFGSSGNFATQIENGAPFDLFFSADVGYPKKLDADGLIVPGSIYHYASGKIVLWTRKDSKLDINRGLDLLLDPSVKKIAIADASHAPYGKAAVEALKHAGLYDKVSSKFVVGENISQTANFAASGAADVGIIALSLALAPQLSEKGLYWLIPEQDYSPIEQATAILKSSHQQELAGRFLKFMQSPEIADLMHRYGFSLPAAPAPRQ
jgi:molybdate transport system substrate-binding protein